MLRVHVLRGDGYRYYVEDLVPGRAEGGMVAGESPGVWSGLGSMALDLDGPVGVADFRDVLDGRDPRSGAALRRSQGGRSVAGYDLTFCAPKSVSVLHLLAPAEIGAEVGAGHRVAVDEAAGYLGRAGVGVRRYRHGTATALPSTGVVAGRFVHRTSRALDPHLHTHLVVANVAQGVDGSWSAVDSRRLFVHAPAAQGIYHARLRFELSDRLGVAWEVSPSGFGDVVGVDATIRRLFSTRSASMDEYAQARSHPSGASGRTRGAFHATRPGKDRHHTVESLTAEWRERAAVFGHDLGDLTRTVGLGRRSGTETPVHPFDPDRFSRQLRVVADRRGTLLPHDLVALVATSTTRGAPASVIESAAARIGAACVRTDQGPGQPASTGPRRPSLDGDPQWSTDEMVRVVAGDIGRLLHAGPATGSPLGGPAGRDGVGTRETSLLDRISTDRALGSPELDRSRWLGR